MQRRYGSLLYALNKLEADYGRLTFDDTICIGQNYRGKTGSLGIGSCTQGFAAVSRAARPPPRRSMTFCWRI